MKQVFSEVVVAHAPALRTMGGQPFELEPILQDIWQSARADWPDLEVGAEAFFQHLAERIAGDEDPLRALKIVRAGDLYLACACSRGSSRALAALESRFIAGLLVSLPGREVAADLQDEVRQRLRVRLLISQEGHPARIASYTGRGPLVAWLRVAATRILIDMHRVSDPGDAGRKGMDQDLSVTQADPELSLLKSRYGAELRQAVEAALAALDAREATVLRLFFLQGMTLEAIGALYRTSNRSARRWVAQARKKILEQARSILGARLQVSKAQLESIIRLAHDEIGPSMLKVLGDDGDPT